jgi:hypothetical protein
MNTTPELTEQLTRTAAGTWGEEAAIWLLAKHDHWLPELQRCGIIHKAGGGTLTVISYRAIDPDPNYTKLNGSEADWEILRIASTLAGTPFIRAEIQRLTRLSEDDCCLALHAIAWASNGRDWADSLRLIASSELCECRDTDGLHQHGCPQF